MRETLSPEVEKGHVDAPEGPGPFGRFSLFCPATRCTLTCIVTDGRGSDDLGIDPWEHVSVSVDFHRRTPRWEEMAWVKQQFWEPEEWVVEYHPAASDYVNDNPRVLHLWRPVGGAVPHPPKICV